MKFGLLYQGRPLWQFKPFCQLVGDCELVGYVQQLLLALFWKPSRAAAVHLIWSNSVEVIWR